jgi:hypothetical protein
MSFVALTILAAGFVGAIFNAGWSIAFCFVLFPLQQLLWSSVDLFFAMRTLPNYLVATAVAMGLVQRIVKSTSDFACALNPVSIGSITLYVWSALTLLWTPSFQSGSEIVIQGIPYVLLFLIAMPLAADTIAVISDFRRGILWLGTVTLVAITLSPAFSFWSGRLVFQFSSEARTNPLAIGELGGLLFLAALLGPPSMKSGFYLLPKFIAAAVGLVAMLQSGSRGQLIGAVSIGVLTLPLARPNQNIVRTIGYLFIGFLILGVIPLVAQWSVDAQSLDRWNTGDLAGASEGRLSNILDALSGWIRSPLYWIPGMGANAFTSVSTAASEGWIHNLTAELLVEYGILGLGLFATLVILTFKDIRWLFDRVKEDPEHRASLALLSAVLVFELFLAQKQANLWGDFGIFGIMCIIARIRRKTERIMSPM